jgi:hypothetical protein
MLENFALSHHNDSSKIVDVLAIDVLTILAEDFVENRGSIALCSAINE